MNYTEAPIIYLRDFSILCFQCVLIYMMAQ